MTTPDAHRARLLSARRSPLVGCSDHWYPPIRLRSHRCADTASSTDCALLGRSLLDQRSPGRASQPTKVCGGLPYVASHLSAVKSALNL